MTQRGVDASSGGTIAYLPPEAFDELPPEANASADMYAVGVGKQLQKKKKY
jgi:hypothetical protein